MRKTLPFLVLLLVLVVPAVAFGQDVSANLPESDAPPLPEAELLPATQFWALLAGMVTPAVAYVLNHYAPWASEPFKAAVLVALAALAGAVAQLIDAGSLGFDTNTLQVLVTAVVGALGAHLGFWRPSGLSTRLGGGTNANGKASA
jgi:peptidoglycan/LPS O-acetylase OafA/YrhL